MKKTKIAVIALSSLIGGLPASSLWAGERAREWGEASRPFDQSEIGISIDVKVGAQHPEASTKIEPVSQPLTRGYNQNEITARMEAPVYRVWEEWQPVPVYYERLECRSYPGEGKGNWHGFFNAPKSEKAGRLADAVKGIGSKTAPCIVRQNVFSSKPRSWSEFESMIEKADSLCGKGIYSNVVIQHGRENMENLGYYNPEVCALVKERKMVDQLVPQKVQVRTIPRDVRMRFINAPLLPSETEVISVSFDGFSAKVDPSSSRYNRYAIQQTGESDFLLSGDRQRTKPNNSLTLLVLARSGDMALRLTDSDYVKGLDNLQARTHVQISVSKPKYWVLSEEIYQTTIELVNGSAEVSLSQILGTKVNPGKTYSITYSVVRTSSRFNNEQASPQKTDKRTR